MRKWFWPTITWTAGLTAMALWFGVERVETDLADRAAMKLADLSWTSFELDGRDIVLKGMAPDPEAKQAAYETLETVRGIREISNFVTVLPAATPYTLEIIKDAEEVRLSGFIPDNRLRDHLIMSIEATNPQLSIDDEMALARGADPRFEERVIFILDMVSKLKNAEVAISDDSFTIKGTAFNSEDYRSVRAIVEAPMPYGLKLAEANIVSP